MSGTKRLVVIDGKSVFYRGYYAMPNLATKDGKPTGGVYGFAVMALEVIKKFKPDYVAVAWDKPKTNIRRRTEIYPQYKANRKPAPPDFYEQVPILHELLGAFGWPLFEIDDHEADDIMATLAKQAHQHKVDTLLITSDHDVLQLVNGHTNVALLKKGLTNVDVIDEERLKEVYDLTPQQFVDYKALKGDPSDNIPGVSGVGDKTAVKLIHDYRSLDGVYHNLDKIKGSLKSKLEAGKDMAFLTRELVILDEDVPVRLNLKTADIKNLDTNTLSALLRELEFRTLIRQLPQDMQQTQAELEKVAQSGDFKPAAKVELIYTAADLKNLKLQPTDKLVLHTRTVGAHFSDLSHIILSDTPNRCVVIDLTGQLEAESVKAKLGSLLKDKKTDKIGHNIKNSLKALLHLGIEARPVGHDVQVGAFLLNSLTRDLSLTDLAQSELGYEGQELENVPPMDIQAAAPKITASIWGLYDLQHKGLKTIPKLADMAHKIEFPVIPVLAIMEHRGIQLNSGYLKKMSGELEEQISDIEQQIYGHANREFNIASPGQLADILFDGLKLPTTGVKKGKTGYSTAARELDKLRGLHPIINLITDYRECAKLKSTYVDALPGLVDDAGRLHTDFSLVVAPTGRLSSSEPNLQNIPVRTDLGRRIREAFVAAKGNVFISADYSQIELRIAAVLAGDDDLIEAFNNGLDIHTRTAAQVYGVAMDDVTKNQRRDAKVINFGVLYGMSPHGLSQATGMTHEAAKEFIERYFELRQPLLDFIDKTKSMAKDKGYVETMFGRRRPTPDVNSSNFVVREAAYRQAVNMPIQGTAADITKLAMIKIEAELASEADQLLQIHDSILVEAPDWKAKKVAKEMKEIMEGVYKLPVSLDVDVTIGQNWGEL
ncbi:MAG TPA: DNA polymerase I [Candidatus Saccharimonadales bacterium]